MRGTLSGIRAALFPQTHQARSARPVSHPIARRGLACACGVTGLTGSGRRGLLPGRPPGAARWAESTGSVITVSLCPPSPPPPVAPVASARSLPARSTKWILLTVSHGISESNLACGETEKQNQRSINGSDVGNGTRADYFPLLTMISQLSFGFGF